MKKVLSVLLVAALLAGLTAVAASAAPLGGFDMSLVRFPSWFSMVFGRPSAYSILSSFFSLMSRLFFRPLISFLITGLF